MNSETRLIEALRRALRSSRQATRAFSNRLLRRLGLLGENWQEALPQELQFWERALSDPNKNWVASEYRERMDPELELQADLKALINAPVGAVVRILDVGAGPLTRLGKKWTGRVIQICPVDPLGKEYQGLWARLNVRPPVYTQVGYGERLLEQFDKDSFDLAYASNALDHSCDPLLAIEQMFSVIKPGCFVYLWHFAHVGLQEGYGGLHQWNFDIVEGKLILSDGRGTHHELGKLFRGRAELSCEFESFAGHTVVVGKLRKLVPH
jgi:SAM-dependent methyltransferase